MVGGLEALAPINLFTGIQVIRIDPRKAQFSCFSGNLSRNVYNSMKFSHFVLVEAWDLLRYKRNQTLQNGMNGGVISFLRGDWADFVSCSGGGNLQ
jgi:hypothetical protein